MAKSYRFVFTDEDEQEADRQTASLAGLAFTLLIVVVGLFLLHQLCRQDALEDCLLSGRTNCDVIVPHLR
ncbi:MAG: hypothetical protein KGJ41_03450 [Rhodospirillales bacterium]|nr:hypothetical protein [Rhodospirillales bacterium]MDE2574355.1 hypothetical protein [Rhodospirillales bacterium]